MCAAQTNTTNQTFGYTWGFADNSRGESVVEISPNINYTVSDAVRESSCLPRKKNPLKLFLNVVLCQCRVKTREKLAGTRIRRRMYQIYSLIVTRINSDVLIT